MMKKSVFLIIIGIVWSVGSSAQQNGNYSMKLMNLYKLNKAFGGVNNQLSLYSMYRSQYDQIQYGPKQFSLNASLPFYKLHGGVGAEVESITNGASFYTKAELSYNYIFNKDLFTLSAGVSTGFRQIGYDSKKIITPEGSYSNGQNHNDPILDNAIQSNVAPIYGLHVFYANPYFDAGLSVSNFFRYTVKIDQTINYTLSRNMNAFLIYYYEVSDNISYRPGLSILSNFKEVQLELLNTVNYGNIFGGVGLRGYSNKSIESMSLYGGIKFSDSYTIGYSFDVLFNQLRKTSEGTHEILFRYDLNREINTGLPPKTMYNPRNL